MAGSCADDSRVLAVADAAYPAALRMIADRRRSSTYAAPGPGDARAVTIVRARRAGTGKSRALITAYAALDQGRVDQGREVRDEEERVYAHADLTPATIDAIAARSHLSAAAVVRSRVALEWRGLVLAPPGQRYARRMSPGVMG